MHLELHHCLDGASCHGPRRDCGSPGGWFRGSQTRAGRAFQEVIPSPEAPPFEGPTLAASQYVVALLEAAKQLPGVRADRVGLCGHSAGAVLAVKGASTSAGVQAVAILLKSCKEKMRDTTIILLIISISFFAIGEIFVRIFKKEPPTMFVASENQKLVYELNRNYKGINSFGMRAKEIDINEIRDLYKIAVIGDSHAYSVNVKNIEETFPYHIEEYLNPNIGQKIVKVLNFGVPGYNTAQELEVLKSKALMFQPKLVILQYHINDTHVCNYIQPKYKKLNLLIHKSKFLVTLWKNILYSPFGKRFLLEWVGDTFPDALLFQEGLVGTRKAADDEVPAHKPHPPRTKDRVPRRYHYMLGEENWRMHVQDFAHLCKQKSILFLATGFIEGEEKAIFLKEGFDVYSFYDIFQDQDMRDYGYNPDNTSSHFNAKGCYLLGKSLADYIQKRYAIAKDQ